MVFGVKKVLLNWALHRSWLSSQKGKENQNRKINK